MAILLLLLLVQGCCSLRPVDLDQHEEQDQDESFLGAVSIGMLTE